MRIKHAIIAVATMFFSLVPSAARAIDTLPYTPPVDAPDSPIIISGYAFNGPRVQYVQLFNTSPAPVDMTGWHVEYMISGQPEPVVVAALGGYIAPLNYMIAGESSSMSSADFGYALSIPPAITSPATAIRLVPPSSYLVHSVALKVDANHYWQRNISATTGKYLSTFTSFIPSANFTLYGGGSYAFPDTTSLQIKEILPNARNCSPLETAADCGDYVKLFNPTAAPIDLAAFRLRTGYQGQTSSASNTYSLAGVVPPGQFATMTQGSDGHAISLTNTGNFVWLEDIYGLKRYDTTVVIYPDASADSKNGQSWALDETDGVWKWGIPSPGGSNVFPEIVEQVSVVKTSVLTPCRDNQYRSEETNRCRNVVVASVPTPCKDDQYRSEATNRCRSIAVAASATLAPCKEGQERNPDTNRCRNVVSNVPNAAFSVEPVKETGKAFIGWWALGGVGVLAVGYGAWEWRREIRGALNRVASFFTASK